MLSSLMEIPVLVTELYEDMTVKNCCSALKNLVINIAKGVFATAVYVTLAQFHPYLLGTSFFLGLGFSDFFMERTSAIWAGIFQTKDLISPSNLGTQKRIYQIWFNVKNHVNYFTPIAVTGLVCFFGLPVFTGPITSVLAGLRLGAYIGKYADLTKFNFQPLYA
jgi:hypothetical protein